ncbi:hypothetical protein ABZU25_07065 [Micromonospora sp. NPDC005215]|uniref:phosphotransferase-like protein n=1 Tax=Micromonospora sp. NPDC005215 TaxID=3157024 RepID=UPI0033AC42B1
MALTRVAAAAIRTVRVFFILHSLGDHLADEAYEEALFRLHPAGIPKRGSASPRTPHVGDRGWVSARWIGDENGPVGADTPAAPNPRPACQSTRGDRPIGLARSQPSVYEIGEFAIVVDTTNNSADECATTIARALDMVPFPKAFDRLHHRRDL